MHIIGAGGHARVVLDALLESNKKITGIWDEDPSIQSLMGHKVLGNFQQFKELKTDFVIIAVGNNRIRKKLALELKDNKGIVVHPKSAISKYTKLGIGTVVMANVTVNAGALIGEYVILNTASSVDHDCKIGDFVHISPNAALAGNVTVGDGTHIGIGASIIQNIKIGNWATIGAGTVIIEDVPDYAVVVGNPGRVIKFNQI
jgi:sugar O-acyltransferase (sialic acid O-acetyltransferase NeuD family)